MPDFRSLVLNDLTDPALAGFDTIIDVRSPAEFAEDHIPGAINLPVLDDDQRAEVGTIYKQVSPFDARKISGALVAANAARHIAGALSDRDGGWQPLVYCWRGGQRSGSFATILSQIGWRVTRLEGGWKTWRSLVVDHGERLGFPSPVVVLDGNTGSAKTEILARLAAIGVQVIDLEGLANHRGSLFGAMPGGQPPQKLFETRLLTSVAALDPSSPVVVEAESSKIGDLILPRAIWRGLCDAPRIQLSVPLSARAAFTAATYRAVGQRTDELLQTIGRLSTLHPAARIAEWQGLGRSGEWAALAAGLMRDHYDPRYRAHRERHPTRDLGTMTLSDLTPASLDEAARRMAGMLSDLTAV